MAEPLDLEAIENRLDFGHRDSWTLLEEVKRLRAERDEVRSAWRKWLTEPTDEESAKGEAVLDRLLGWEGR